MFYEVLCTQPNNIGAWFLRLVMWSRWSHSAIYDAATGVVYDTTFWGGGVEEHEASHFFEKYSKSEQREILVIDRASALIWLDDQVGKKYDWTALLSWIVRRNWQDEDSWFCSELTEAFRNLFSTPRFREKVSRITPRHQDMVI